MPSTALFVTHPEVTVDPAAPVPAWRLSDRGIARTRAFPARGRSGRAGKPRPSKRPACWPPASAWRSGWTGAWARTNRSATGFLPPAGFERVADEFFADPHRSVRGWERAIDAQERVARTVSRILDAHGAGGGDIAFVAHGGVGALLLCRLLGAPISRGRDRPFQGHFFAFGLPGRKIIHEWRPIAER